VDAHALRVSPSGGVGRAVLGRHHFGRLPVPAEVRNANRPATGFPKDHTLGEPRPRGTAVRSAGEYGVAMADR
jgi:hypothetical protein